MSENKNQSNEAITEVLTPDEDRDLDPSGKLPSEMTYSQLVMHIARNKIFRFLILNEDGTYSYTEKTRKSLSNDQKEKLEKLRIIAANFRNLERVRDDDKKSIYFNNSYYLWEDGLTRFYTQNDALNFYFMTLIHYSFKIPYSDLKNYAYDDDPEEMDKNDAYCYPTICRVINEIGNLGLSFFRNISKNSLNKTPKKDPTK